MSNSLWPHVLGCTRLLCPWDSSGKNTGVVCHALLQRFFPIQGVNLCLLHCRQILYCWATGKPLQGRWSSYYLSWSFLRILDILSNLKPSLSYSSISLPGQGIAPSRCSIKHLEGTWTVERMSGPQVRFISIALKIKFNKLCFAVKGIDWHV